VQQEPRCVNSFDVPIHTMARRANLSASVHLITGIFVVASMLLYTPSLAQINSSSYKYYLSLTLTTGPLFYPSSSEGNLNIAIPYTTTSGGNSEIGNFVKDWRIPYQDRIGGWGTGVNIEVGNFRRFVTVRAGGNEFATTFYGGVGFNFYKSLSCNRHCMVIKPSLNFGINQTYPFNSGGNNRFYLGSIDNENKTVEIAGHTFSPTYQTKSSVPVNAKTVDIFYTENNAVLIPQISFGNNNLEHVLSYSIKFAYYMPLSYRRGLAFFQDNVNSQADTRLNTKNDMVTFNNASLSSMPSIAEGIFIGVSLSVNFSRDIILSYGTQKQRDNFDMCPCERHKSPALHHWRENKIKRQRKKNKKDRQQKTSPVQQPSPNSLGF